MVRSFKRLIKTITPGWVLRGVKRILRFTTRLLLGAEPAAGSTKYVFIPVELTIIDERTTKVKTRKVALHD